MHDQQNIKKMWLFISISVDSRHSVMSAVKEGKEAHVLG
jgi:hypothetical protein